MTKKKYKQPKKWLKFRHKAVFSTLRYIFIPYFKLRYRYKYTLDEKKAPSPCIIMSNHQSTMDPFFLSLSFKRPIYFIMSEDLFTLGFLSSVIKYLVEPIPKAKSRNDINTIRCALKVLSEGGTIGLFPSGNRTLSGEEWQIDPSAAKLIKLAKVPLVLYNIKGGYGSDPRWGNGVRKGKVTGGTVKVISAEELNEMSVEEIHSEIVRNLSVKDFELGIKFKSKKRAEHLERALYYCPNCGSFNTVRSHGKSLYCSACDMEAEYKENLKFFPIVGKTLGSTVSEWFEGQKAVFKEKASKTTEPLFGDGVAEVRLIENYKRKKLGAAKIIGSSLGVTVKTASGKNFNVRFKDLIGCTVLGKRKINFYIDDKVTLQIKGSKRFNAVKYLHLYEFYKEGEANE